MLVYCSFRDLQKAVGYHPNIVQIINHTYHEEDEVMWVCMEVSTSGNQRECTLTLVSLKLCDGGDLERLIAEQKASKLPFPESTIWSIFAQLVLGLQACHQSETRTGANPDQRSIIHRDLKPANGKLIIAISDRSSLTETLDNVLLQYSSPTTANSRRLEILEWHESWRKMRKRIRSAE